MKQPQALERLQKSASAPEPLSGLVVVVPGNESYDLGPKVNVVSILHLVERLGRMAEEPKT